MKTFEGKAESPRYVYKRRLLYFIPIPAPYKELDTDQRSYLRKFLDAIFGTGQTVQMVAAPPVAGTY